MLLTPVCSLGRTRSVQKLVKIVKKCDPLIRCITLALIPRIQALMTSPYGCHVIHCLSQTQGCHYPVSQTLQILWSLHYVHLIILKLICVNYYILNYCWCLSALTYNMWATDIHIRQLFINRMIFIARLLSWTLELSVNWSRLRNVSVVLWHFSQILVMNSSQSSFQLSLVD